VFFLFPLAAAKKNLGEKVNSFKGSFFSFPFSSFPSPFAGSRERPEDGRHVAKSVRNEVCFLLPPQTARAGQQSPFFFSF